MHSFLTATVFSPNKQLEESCAYVAGNFGCEKWDMSVITREGCRQSSNCMPSCTSSAMSHEELWSLADPK